MTANPFFWMALLPILPGAAIGNALRPPGLSRRPARFLRMRVQLVFWSLAVVPVIVASGAIGTGACQALFQGPVLIGSLVSLLLSVFGGRVRLAGGLLLLLGLVAGIASGLVVSAYPAGAGASLGQILAGPAGSGTVQVSLGGEPIGELSGESAVPIVERVRVDPRLFVAPRLQGFRLAGAAGLERVGVGDQRPSGEALRRPVPGVPGILIDLAPRLFLRADLPLPAELPIPGVPTSVSLDADGRRIILR